MKASELKEMDIKELFEQLNELDMENVGSWPLAVKIAAAILVLLAVVGLGYYFFILDANAQLERLQQEESSLLSSYEKKAFDAHNLEQYRQQLAEMEETFGTLVKQLPTDTEVPGLLEDISHTGLGSGLEFKTIDLKSEIQKEFYVELPIDIKVTGDYHAFGTFVSGVAALPRIVTLHDFTLSPLNKNDPGLLSMQITAKTYRYASKGEKKNKRKGRRS